MGNTSISIDIVATRGRSASSTEPKTACDPTMITLGVADDLARGADGVLLLFASHQPVRLSSRNTSRRFSSAAAR